MKVIPAAALCLSVALPLLGVTSSPEGQASSSQGSAPSATTQADARVGLAPGFRNAGVAARNMELVVNLPKPEGFYDPEAPAGRPRRPRPEPTTPDATAGESGAQPEAAAAPPTAAASRLWFELFEHRHRLQWRAPVHGQLPRLHHLQRRGRHQGRASRFCRVSRGPGRSVGLRQPSLHLGAGHAGAARLRHPGRPGAGQRRAFPRRSYLRHQRREEPATGSGSADLPRISYPHAGRRSRRR